MAALLYFPPMQPAFDGNGNVAAGAQLFFYATGTSNLASIYTTSALSTEHPNPLTANASGVFPDIYINDAITHRAKLVSAAGATLYDIDPFLPLSASQIDFRFASILDVTDDGSADITTAFETAVEAMDGGGILWVPPGTYLRNSAHTQFSGLSDITIVFAPGAVLQDNGRIVPGASGATSPNRRIPWGIEFFQCDDITIIGGMIETTGDVLTGSSDGFWDETNYTLRKPVLGFRDCNGVKVLGLKQKGNPGVAITTTDRDAIVTALALTPTQAEYAYFSLRAAFFNAHDCTKVLYENVELVADTCAREQMTFSDSTNGRIIRPTSRSTGNNFASMGKIIGCTDFHVSDIQCSDTGTGSLWDLIGSKLSVTNSSINYPNGKLADISHEWGPANKAGDNILIADCRTTGDGVITVVGSSSTAQIEDNDITGVEIRNVQANVGRSDWTSDHFEVRLPTVIDYTVRGGTSLNTSIAGFTHTNQGGQRVKVYDKIFRWTVATASLDNNSRTFSVAAAGLLEFHNCDLDADQFGSGPTAISLVGGAGGKIRFVGCRLRDINFAIDTVAVELENCDTQGVTFGTPSSGGSYSVVDTQRRIGFLTGMALTNNATDATNDIDFASGRCVDSTGDVEIVCAALTKQLDAAWAVGDDAGGLDTGAIADGTYHCFAILKDDGGTGDFLFSASATAPTMPSGYTYFRRIGSILRESGAIVAFVQRGDTFLRSPAKGDLNAAAPGTGNVNRTLSVPLGIEVEALITGTLEDLTPAVITCAVLSSALVATVTAATTRHSLMTSATGATNPVSNSSDMRLITNTSGVIRSRLNNSDADISLIITTHGWVDRRGRY